MSTVGCLRREAGAERVDAVDKVDGVDTVDTIGAAPAAPKCAHYSVRIAVSPFRLIA
jgi:hypothetical protein